jgi:prepilin-type N-terminal cleavage/methylation domain-containing protein
MFRRQAYSLVEMLVAMSLIALLAGVSVQLLHGVILHTRESSRQAFLGQEIFLLKKNWQQFVGNADLVDWHGDETEITAGDCWATLEEHRLVLQHANQVRELVLPPFLQATLAAEGPMAILNLHWSYRLQGKDYQRQTRLLAVARVKGQAE